jgi:hypothetical protein
MATIMVLRNANHESHREAAGRKRPLTDRTGARQQSASGAMPEVLGTRVFYEPLIATVDQIIGAAQCIVIAERAQDPPCHRHWGSITHHR